jgi:hypothetical protein
MRANGILRGPPVHRGIVVGLSAHLLCVVAMVSTNAEAQSRQDEVITGRYYQVTARADEFIEDTEKRMRSVKCLDQKTIFALEDDAAGALSDLSLLRHDPRLPPYIDPGPHANPPDSAKEIDKRERQIHQIVRDLQKMACPPPEPEPVKRYWIGTLLKPAPEERIEIGASGKGWTGPYFGLETMENFGRVRSTESLATTDMVTNQFTDSGDPLGVGIVGGYNFKPWNNKVVIGPFASFDYLNQTINHNFAGGQFLGTTTHWFMNAGLKAGVVTAPGFYFYGLAGAAFLNHDLNVNFATTAQSNVTTPGFMFGVGGEYQPPSWKLSGLPVSLFAQYQHTWWSNANFNAPTSSPAFNYAFRREDDTIKFGVNFYFGAAPAPAAPAYPVKALPAK